jgi:hypothetical protein
LSERIGILYFKSLNANPHRGQSHESNRMHGIMNIAIAGATAIIFDIAFRLIKASRENQSEKTVMSMAIAPATP